MNAADLAVESLDRFGERAAYIFEGREYSNVAHLDYSSRLASYLRECGVRPGDRVLVLMENSPDVMACFQAIWRIGAVIVPTTPQLGVREIAYVLAHSEVSVALLTPALVEKVRQAAVEAPALRKIFAFGPVDAEDVEDILPSIESASPVEGIVDRGDDDMALLLYTSGTTGRPKGVMLSHQNLLSNHRSVVALKRLDERSTTVLALPLSHTYGVLMMNLCHLFACTASVLPKFDAAAVLGEIEKHRVTRFSVVPTMLVRLMNAPGRDEYDVSSLEVVTCGGAILMNEVRTEFERIFECRVLDGYGLSECSPTVTGYRGSESLRPGSIGRPISCVDVAIMDESCVAVSTGERGEICVRGPNVMMGYWKDDAATTEAMRGGWFHTGDVGYFGEDDYVYLTDRMKDLIIKGGENISPREIEEALVQHPAVSEAVVIGVADATYGENIVAVVALREGHSATADDLSVHTGKFVTKFKIPARFEIRDELPKNANGKLDRRRLKSEIESVSPAPSPRV